MCENIFLVTNFLHVVIPVPEVHCMLITCKTVVITTTWWWRWWWWLWEGRGGSGGVGCVSQSVLAGNFFDPLQNTHTHTHTHTHTEHFYSWDELNNWKEHGLLNCVLQINIVGITPNILAKQSDPRQYWKIRAESQQKIRIRNSILPYLPRWNFSISPF